MTLRDAINLANEQDAGDPGVNQEIWLPAWKFVLRIERDGEQVDIEPSYGDLDVKDSLTIRGVSGSTSVGWRSGSAIDKVFELVGDYNNDLVSDPPGNVDSADYVIWRQQENMTGTGLAADGNEDGVVNNLDFDLWKAHYGNTLTLEDILVS
jgi:hypothetical protein